MSKNKRRIDAPFYLKELFKRDGIDVEKRVCRKKRVRGDNSFSAAFATGDLNSAIGKLHVIKLLFPVKLAVCKRCVTVRMTLTKDLTLSINVLNDIKDNIHKLRIGNIGIVFPLNVGKALYTVFLHKLDKLLLVS